MTASLKPTLRLSPCSSTAPPGLPDAFLERHPGLFLQHHGVSRPVREVHECETKRGLDPDGLPLRVFSLLI